MIAHKLLRGLPKKCVRKSVFCVSSQNVRHASTIIKKEKIEEFTFKNEPILPYMKAQKETKELRASLKKLSSSTYEIPIVIGGKEYRTGKTRNQLMPHKNKKVLAKFHLADKKLLKKATEVAYKAQKKWDRRTYAERIKIWLKAANLMAGKYRADLNASCMLGQSKTIFQAEIDSACELIDFFRYACFSLKEACKWQPNSPDPKTTINLMQYRGFDGFVAAISPFNFTAIGGNISYTPALIGNAVCWKPASTATLSNYFVYKACAEAGVPPGVMNFLPCQAQDFSKVIITSKYLAGINFTGSVEYNYAGQKFGHLHLQKFMKSRYRVTFFYETLQLHPSDEDVCKILDLGTFYNLWQNVGKHIDKYINFPRLCGEVGGKNFHFVHPSADIDSVVAGSIRSAYEYCGQKCSALSRIYCAESVWPKIRDKLVAETKKIKFGDVTDVKIFSGAVIDKNSYNNIKGYIEHAKKESSMKILVGGKYSDKVGYFIDPTIVETKDPKCKLMLEEIFGPILTCYVFKDKDIEKALQLCDTSTQFALTGSIYSQDRKFLAHAVNVLKNATGNLYLNDKSTGSVVAQQPFGGARKSGTNDKAGSPTYVLRFSNPLAIKETFAPMRDILYPYMTE